MHNHEPSQYDCPFCRMVNGEMDRANEVVFESEQSLVCIGLHNHEHSGPTFLVVPKVHVENIYDIEDELFTHLHLLSKHVAMRMRQLWNTQGISVWQNNEQEGSQDVWHFHIHVKARFVNDRIYSSKVVRTPINQKMLWANELRTNFLNTP